MDNSNPEVVEATALPPINPLIARLSAAAGTQHKLACGLGLKGQSAISSWRKSGRVPSEHVLGCERLTGVPRHQIRPDLYPPEDQQMEPAQHVA